MEELSAEELHCLRRLAGPASVPFTPCAPRLLEGLQRRGLVAVQPRQWWPLGNRYDDYILTPKGRRLLEERHG